MQLTVRRRDELMDVSVKRADVVNSGIYFQQFDQIGYLQISAFNNATPAAFKGSGRRTDAAGRDPAGNLICGTNGGGLPDQRIRDAGLSAAGG